MKLKLRPLHDRIIVKRLEEERKIGRRHRDPGHRRRKALDGRSRRTPARARPTTTASSLAMGVKVGDKILFGKYSGQEFKLEGQDLLHMREDDVIGVVA